MQLLRAPSVLKGYHALENALGEHLQLSNGTSNRWINSKWRDWFYRWAMERGTFDIFLDEYVVTPFLRIFQWSDRNERLWLKFLAGKSDQCLDKNHDERQESDLV